jgi:hypothetical protein
MPKNERHSEEDLELLQKVLAMPKEAIEDLQKLFAICEEPDDTHDLG